MRKIRNRLSAISERRRQAAIAFRTLPFSGFLSYQRASSGLLKRGRGIEIRVSDGHNVRLRYNQTDRQIFEQIFLFEDCAVPLPGFKPSLIIDCGAHVGCSTLYYAITFPEALIIAVEAHAGNFRQLCLNVRDLPNVKPVHAAVQDEDGARMALSNPADDGWGFRFLDRDPSAGPEVESVETVSVGSLISGSPFDRCDLLKMDVEGAEKDVFLADTDWLATLAVLIIELHDRFRPGCAEALQEALVRYDYEEHSNAFNYVYVNKKRPALTQESGALPSC